MNRHLNPEEILQVADKAVANGALTAAMEHLAACSQCRKEVEFQRELRRTAERIGPARVSKNFTSNVLRAVGAPVQKGLFSRLSNNLGSLFALLMVVGLFGILTSYLQSFDSSNAASGQGIWGDAVKRAEGLWNQASGLLPSITLPAKRLPVGESGDIIAPIALACLLLMAVDSAVRQYQRLRLRKRQ